MSAVNSDSQWNDAEAFVGCRYFPKIDAMRHAITITREAFEQLQRHHRDPVLRREHHNAAVMHVVWHQQFAIAARGSKQIYIPRASISKDGLASLRDKDNQKGYKCRLVWFPRMLLRQMEILESIGHLRTYSSGSLGRPRCEIDEMPVFYRTLRENAAKRPQEISREGLLEVTAPFFPFPINTPRRVMRYLLWERGLSPEYLDIFMGHWRERQEPWSRWSTLDYGDYLETIRGLVPSILRDLGFNESGTTHDA